MITFKLTPNDFQINDSSLSFPIDIEHLSKVLKDSDRINKKKHNVIYTWDELGILAYSKDGKMIEGLVINLKQKDYDFSPRQTFQGTFFYDNEEIISYYKTNKEKRVKLFDGDSSGALVLNSIRAWFDCDYSDKNTIESIEISAFKEPSVKKISKEKYLIKKLDEEEIKFVDFGFKISIIQELMYNKELIKPKFDLFEFVSWYSERDINLEEEGYEPIEEITQYFKDLQIPKRLAPEITKIYQDGGNDIYLNLIRFAEGWEDCWDIESIEDFKNFPNLKKATLCYAKDHVLEALNNIGIKAEWL